MRVLVAVWHFTFDRLWAPSVGILDVVAFEFTSRLLKGRFAVFVTQSELLNCLCDIQQDAKHLLRLEHCFCVESCNVLCVSNPAHTCRIFSARKPLVYQELCTDPNQRDIHHFYSLCDKPYQASHRCANTDNWHITHLGLPGDPHFVKSKNTADWRLTSGLLSKLQQSICGGYSFRLSCSCYWSTKCGWGWSPSCSASLLQLGH